MCIVESELDWKEQRMHLLYFSNRFQITLQPYTTLHWSSQLCDHWSGGGCCACYQYTFVCRVAPGSRPWRWLGSLALCSLLPPPLGVSPDGASSKNHRFWARRESNYTWQPDPENALKVLFNDLLGSWLFLEQSVAILMQFQWSHSINTLNYLLSFVSPIQGSQHWALI